MVFSAKFPQPDIVFRFGGSADYCNDMFVQFQIQHLLPERICIRLKNYISSYHQILAYNHQSCRFFQEPGLTYFDVRLDGFDVRHLQGCGFQTCEFPRQVLHIFCISYFCILVFVMSVFCISVFCISYFHFKLGSFRTRCCPPPHDCVNPSHRCLK